MNKHAFLIKFCLNFLQYHQNNKVKKEIVADIQFIRVEHITVLNTRLHNAHNCNTSSRNNMQSEKNIYCA